MHRIPLRRPIAVFVAAALGTVLGIAPAAAAPAARGLGLPTGTIHGFSLFRRVPDAVLGAMRGKFVAPSGIAYFGVQMNSTWQTHSGTLVAGADLNVRFANTGGSPPSVTFVPTVTIVAASTGGAGPAPLGTHQTSSIGGCSAGGCATPDGLQGVTGVTQVVQVAGGANAAGNALTVNVQSGGTPPAGSPGPNSASATGPDGTTATASLGNDNLGVTVVVPGNGQLMQQIRGQAAGQSPGILQMAQVNGNFQQAHNTLAVTVGLQNALNAASGFSALAPMVATQQVLGRIGM